jgi:hypothetical protein
MEIDDYRVEVNKKGRNMTDPALGFQPFHVDLFSMSIDFYFNEIDIVDI